MATTWTTVCRAYAVSAPYLFYRHGILRTPSLHFIGIQSAAGAEWLSDDLLKKVQATAAEAADAAAAAAAVTAGRPSAHAGEGWLAAAAAAEISWLNFAASKVGGALVLLKIWDAVSRTSLAVSRVCVAWGPLTIWVVISRRSLAVSKVCVTWGLLKIWANISHERGGQLQGHARTDKWRTTQRLSCKGGE